eukprot:scaffold47946_cov23-Tisochrysis_lutea.AAC.1
MCGEIDSGPVEMDVDSYGCKETTSAAAQAVDRPKVGVARHVHGLAFVFHGSFGGKPCRVLFDTGASGCF